MRKIGYGSLVWFLATLFSIYAFCLNTAAAVFSDAIKTSLNLSTVNTTVALSSFIIGFACMQIPAGYLLDRYNIRYILSSAVLLLTFGTLMTSYSGSFGMFLTANFIQGIGASFAFIAVGKIISQWFVSKMFAILFGLSQTLSCILTAVLHYVFMMELKVHTWNALYLILALCGLVLFILILLFVKAPATSNMPNTTNILSSLKIVSKNSQLWLCTFAGATSFGVLLAYASFWYAPIQTFYSVITTQASIISGMIFVGIGIGTPLLGWLSNYLHSRKVVLHVTLCLGNMALLAGIYLPHFHVDTLVIIKIVSFFIGLFLSGSMLFYTVVSEISSDDTRAISLSIINTAVFLFNSLLMFIPRVFITAQSNLFFTFLWVLPFFLMASLLILYFIKETYHE